MNENTDEVLNDEQMKKVFKLNPYLRDNCGVPFTEAFRIAMLIVGHWDNIKKRVEDLPAANPRSRLIDLYVRDKQSGKVHRIGDDRHDHLTVDSSGQVHYYNLQNGDGCYSGDGNHVNGVVVSGAYGYEFVPNEDDYGYNIDPREDK